ncbi:putative periplasmic serine endoprotease DegP-like precursor [Gemmata obscuriglobus]|uniref:PDZ domain-containing protein n=1 Tax=Gemmata obscuriglobus TaxID=114 RepID=A0A2Z3H058_9BACT|nr:trypsin-like peptidase domain-containing protein [Gemmata obscuriglobus]AWM37682.1 PDZ domain-containing protein [Gemmata obscuriglobus]QEG29510.1 putative periplasmic serine endoprotease DegP-like precursor [Gemmata obscuriglobus]VTS08693.1 pdz dhr glgf domain protein : PDZ/DHR/GLGF domain protein OS=Pirellula staleyi (strain ATCC 27377 / DSM 6068 / ICPB 4128) GN=Psta_3926 PE=4 SV=1: Trypsin_2: PDZ_2 [Gemmata obscuriglobus UQM 2246]
MYTRLIAATLALVALGAPAQAQIGKDTKLLGPFKPIVARASESTVRIKCDDKDTILGTIVDEAGYILTKASELKGTIWVRLPDGSEYEAAKVAAHNDTDLALLKVDVKGLRPVTFTDTEKLPRGNWLAAAGPNSDPISVGIVSVMTRKLTGLDAVAAIRDPNRGVMGVYPEDATDDDGKAVGAKLRQIEPTGAAAKAGLKVGDIVVELNGKPVTTSTTMRDQLASLRSGDVVTVKAKRSEEIKNFKLTLGRAELDRGDIQNSMGSTLSNRRTGFPQVLQTDLVVDAKDCGGPVVDLEGNVLGINIARAGRVETWILPSEVIRPLLPDLKAGKFAVVSTKKLPEAPAPHAPKGK